MKAPTLTKIGKVLLLTTGTAAAVFVGSSLAMGWALVRPSRRNRFDCVSGVRHGTMTAVELTASDGVKLHAWVVLSRFAAPQDWVILLHGYRSDREASHRRRRFFTRRGFNVLLLHFRGHGGSQPERISYGYHERLDVMAAFNYIGSLPIEGRLRIGVDGRSMGAAAAAYAVGQGEISPDWMILESCYDTIEHALANRLERRVGPLTPLVAWPLELVVEQLVDLRAEDLDPAKALSRANCPILVLAGDSERVLKEDETRHLFSCIPGPKRLELFPGADHEDLLAHDPKRYIRVVDAFLRDYGQTYPEISSPGEARTPASAETVPATGETVVS